MSVSVDPVLACIAAEYVSGIFIIVFIPDFANIKVAVICVACYADSGFLVDIVGYHKDTL